MQKDYQVCSKTILDTTYPNITFDEAGISNHYYEFHKHVVPNWKTDSIGDKILSEKIEIIKKEGEGKEFDSIIGLSGGADSSYMLHKMVKDYGLRPLVFHVDGGWNSEIAVNNISKLISGLNLELFTEVINWEEMKNFQLALFKSGVPHLDTAQDHAFISVLYRFANKHNIKFIFNGGNISTECVLRPLDIIYWGTDMRQINDILKKFGTRKMKTYPFTSIFYHKLYLRYFRNIQVIKPLNFMDYHKEKAMKELESTYGWKPYPQKHFESRFTRFFEGYWLPERFNFDMRRVDLSSLILTGQKSREEALRELENPPYNDELIHNDFSYIAKKLEISKDELNSYLRMPLKYYWDYKNQRKVFQVGEYFLSRLAGARRGGAF
jgi:N-acetyl sugar amidotransferase